MSTAAGFQDLKSMHGLARILGQRGPRLLAGALIIALGLDSALILTRALSGPEAPPAASAVPLSAAPHSSTNPQALLATILNAHLFGSAAGPAGGADAPATTMPLILAGVIADRDPSKGEAIIGENAAGAKLYSVNAVIPGGARLHAVYGDRVLLERNGGLETLALPHTSLGGTMPRREQPAPLPTAASLRQNPSLLAGLVRVQPVFTQGKLSGYRIFPGGANGATAFSQLGLRPGDLILAVNGTTLEDPARAMEVLQTLSSSGSATITVSRNGAAQEINLNLATLNSLQSGDAGQSAAQSSRDAASPSARPPGAAARRNWSGIPSDSSDPGAAPQPSWALPGRVSGSSDR